MIDRSIRQHLSWFDTLKQHLLTTVLCVALPVCSVSASAESLTIGFSQIGSESGWRTSETESIKAEAERRGYNLKFSDAQQKQENQIKAVRSFIAQGVDGILLAPVVETGWDQVLKEAKRAHIPVVLVDRGVDANPDLYLTKVASDFREEGALAASWLAAKTNGKCNIVELQGTVGSSAAIDRKAGFDAVISNFPNMKIIRSQSGDFTRAGGKEVMESFLKAESNPKKDICALFSHNDDMALGAILAMKEAGIKPSKDILVVSIDGVPDIFKAMMDGESNATIELNPHLGAPAFDAILAYRAGKTVPKWIKANGPLYLPDTAAAEYNKRK
ncbi:ABC transporter periplasmic-binding protein YtfQ precursor [Marinomonas spartinae]|uniref:ABC transporter periplasmic-binding protein YtfQ n=1 Tax=Marinomonas spartinae TaxID=1792290 RepID=A0A1A8T9G5_9GAMM|nr:ABC transporter substrate-binding protein [Marinomonas spartinae]SBS28237.1 ABC transporter periplasmic-binding protein YtfQ precursor [Marinomonas spartinae]SBS28428.1 ABC transporter periplasmic-binding protein YtfQ precursor [Marinomonas spartinae]